MRQRKPPKERKCEECPEMFTPPANRPFQKVCSIGCAVTNARKKQEKKQAKEVEKQEKERRKETKELKKSIMTHGDWLKLLQKVFNTYIRIRDKGEGCISCGTTDKVDYDAGHFWPAGNYSFLRFHPDNVHKQCSMNCNKQKHGNVGEYRIRLIEKIGPERVQYLDDNRHRSLKLTIPEIQEQIAYFKEQISLLNAA